jgi:hypothetical protein
MNGAAIRGGLDRMARITWHDGDQAGSYDLGCAIDGHLKRALDHLVDRWNLSVQRSRIREQLL